MDPRERMDDLRVVLRTALDSWQGQLWTALPAMVNSYDATKMTVSAQPTIQARVLSQSGTWTNTTLPLCQDCPVAFPSGGGFTMTFPIAQGDEGILVFSSRCIDNWWQLGSSMSNPAQPQAEFRMHDLSDGMFIPGLFSQKRKLANASTSVVQIRSTDGNTLFEVGPQELRMTPDGGVTQIKIVPGYTQILGNLQISGAIQSITGSTYAGNLQTTGNVIAGFGSGDQVGLQTHKHTQPNDSHGDTEQPTNSPTAGT